MMDGFAQDSLLEVALVPDDDQTLLHTLVSFLSAPNVLLKSASYLKLGNGRTALQYLVSRTCPLSRKFADTVLVRLGAPCVCGVVTQATGSGVMILRTLPFQPSHYQTHTFRPYLIPCYYIASSYSFYHYYQRASDVCMHDDLVD
jgi:hypothetical protein